MVTLMVQMRPGTQTTNSLTKKSEILMKNWEKLPKIGKIGLEKILPQYKKFLAISILFSN